MKIRNPQNIAVDNVTHIGTIIRGIGARFAIVTAYTKYGQMKTILTIGLVILTPDNMKGATRFKNLTPREKAAKILDGCETLSAKIQLLHLDLMVLNSWIETAPDLIEKGECDIPNTHSMARLIQSVEDSNDSLADEYIRYVELMQKLTDCILRNA